MSTRSNIIVEDQYRRIQIYRHYDGYPENILPALQEAMPYAWELPRFEADEFAAALVSAWKKHEGSIRIDGNPKGWELIHSDVEWVYVISATENGPIVRVYEWCPDYWFDKKDPAQFPPPVFMECALVESATAEIPMDEEETED